MGCMHTKTVRTGGAKCCLKCGYTIAPGRPPFYDKDIVNYNGRKERAKRAKKD